MKSLLIAYVLAAGLDTTTSCLVLNQGGRELNPLMPSTCELQILVRAATTTGTMVLVRQLHKRHPIGTKVGLVVGIAVTSAVVAHNARQLR